MSKGAFSNLKLMKSLSASFDESATADIGMLTISSGVPATVLEEKGRLLGGVRAMPTWTSSSSDIVELENAQLREENLYLRGRLRTIEDRLATLEASLPKNKVVVLRGISKPQAKKEIIALFAKEKTLYYSDIAERLGLDLQLVVEVCQELEDEGVIS